MKRHLRIKAEFNPDTGKIDLTVLQMTHLVNNGFSLYSRGKRSDYGPTNTFISSNGIRMKSDNSTCGVSNEFVTPRSFSGKFSFYLPQYGSEINGWKCTVTEDEWKEIRCAVKEYNRLHEES